MIRQWIDKLLEDLRRTVARITTMGEILLGVILALVLTRHLSYHSDKLSRLAPPSELIERHSPYGIRSLA